MAQQSRRFRLTLLTALLLPLVFLLLGSVLAAPTPIPREPAVEVVFCLDTTGSMSGLIEGAKLKAWSICNQILSGRPMPRLKVGLVAFRDKGDEYVSRIYDLREDLDDVYTDLRTFNANGGGDTPEAVNQALDDSINKINWSTDKRTLRIVFVVGDAPPHMDYHDDVKYPITCARAVARGIIINTIQCGTDADCTRFWKDICEKSGGAYAAIPQAGGATTVYTPYDKRLSEINKELARTTLVFGDAPKREADGKKAQMVQSLPVEIAADRAGYLAKEGKVARYDLIDAIRSGKLKLESLRDEELPSELKKMGAKDRQEYLDKIHKQRQELLREASLLDKQRTNHINKETSRNKDSFDNQVLDMLRKQSTRRIRY